MLGLVLLLAGTPHVRAAPQGPLVSQVSCKADFKKGDAIAGDGCVCCCTCLSHAAWLSPVGWLYVLVPTLCVTRDTVLLVIACM